MSRKLTVVFLAMLVLVGAMSLRTVAVTHGDGSVIMANGGAPVPTGGPAMANGGAPVPTGGPAVVGPWKANGGAPVPTGGPAR